jgi:hypothetical protein
LGGSFALRRKNNWTDKIGEGAAPVPQTVPVVIAIIAYYFSDVAFRRADASGANPFQI